MAVRMLLNLPPMSLSKRRSSPFISETGNPDEVLSHLFKLSELVVDQRKSESKEILDSMEHGYVDSERYQLLVRKYGGKAVNNLPKLAADLRMIDPLEFDCRYEFIFTGINQIVRKMLEARPMGIASSHMLWSQKKIVIFERYGVVWLDPRDMMPGADFD